MFWDPYWRFAPRLALVVITAYATIDTAVDAMRRGRSTICPSRSRPTRSAPCSSGRRRFARAPRPRGRPGRAGPAEVPEVDLEPGSSRESARPRAGQRSRRRTPASCSVARTAPAKGSWPARSMPGAAGRPPVRHRQLPEPQPRAARERPLRPRPGAFTGAIRDVAGKVAAAEGGTLFLDEIGDLPSDAPAEAPAVPPGDASTSGSAKTDRAWPTSGSSPPRTATSKRPIAAGAFREDLLYRLNVVELTLPPLTDPD